MVTDPEAPTGSGSASSSGCSSRESSSSSPSSSGWLKRSSLYGLPDSSAEERSQSCCRSYSRWIGRWLVGKLSASITPAEAWLLGLVVIVNFLSYSAGSMLAPVLPQHLAMKKRQFHEAGAVSESEVSIAFVLYAGTSMIFSLVFGSLIPRLGINPLYFFGLSTVAVSNIVLGALDLMPIETYREYIFAQCVARVLEGIGAAAFNTSSHSIIMKVFSRHIDEAFATVEAAVAISFSLGPVLGSFLVRAFGWSLAFCIFGLAVIATMPLSIWIFDNYGSMEYRGLSSSTSNTFLPVRIVCTWNGFFVLICMLVTTTAYSFVEPTLELFLENVVRSEYSVAYYFAQAAAFALSALVVAPFLAARNKLCTMLIGTVILALGFLVIGPCRYFFPDPNASMTMAGVVFLGFGFALAYVPTLDLLFDIAVTGLGYLKGPSTYGPISGLWNFLNGFGETFGPVLAMFQTSPDFRDAALMLSAALFSSAIILMLVALIANLHRGIHIEEQKLLCHPEVHPPTMLEDL